MSTQVSAILSRRDSPGAGEFHANLRGAWYHYMALDRNLQLFAGFV